VTIHASWYFDFISPYAYLQLPRVCALTEGVEIDFKPILFAGLLDYHEKESTIALSGRRAFFVPMLASTGGPGQ
jgi:2-hydroxychromene-2-carboxylate isomerase